MAAVCSRERDREVGSIRKTIHQIGGRCRRRDGTNNLTSLGVAITFHEEKASYV